MYYIGIDIGKNNHVASMMGGSRKIAFRAFSFSNTREGAGELLAKIGQNATEKEQIETGLEATGHYWLALYSFLFDAGYLLHVINPIQTDGWCKGIEIRKRKTDDIDSVLIADLFRYGEFNKPSSPMNISLYCSLFLIVVISLISLAFSFSILDQGGRF